MLIINNGILDRLRQLDLILLFILQNLLQRLPEEYVASWDHIALGVELDESRHGVDDDVRIVDARHPDFNCVGAVVDDHHLWHVDVWLHFGAFVDDGFLIVWHIQMAVDFVSYIYKGKQLGR